MTGTPETKAKLAPKRRAEHIRQIRAKGRPALTFERVSELLSYNPDEGIFRHKVSRGGQKAGSVAGTVSNGYNAIFVFCFQYKASRLAWLLMTGEQVPAGKVIDHINGDKHDDRWSNLRLATPAENARNRGFCKRNTSGKVGVYPIKGQDKWGAEIGLGGRNLRLGRFNTLDEAIAARKAAELVYYGEFTRAMPEVYANG